MRRSDLRAWGAFPSEAMCQQRESDVSRFGICRPHIVESRPEPHRRGAEIWCFTSRLYRRKIEEDLQTRATLNDWQKRVRRSIIYAHRGDCYESADRVARLQHRWRG